MKSGSLWFNKNVLRMAKVAIDSHLNPVYHSFVVQRSTGFYYCSCTNGNLCHVRKMVVIYFCFKSEVFISLNSDHDNYENHNVPETLTSPLGQYQRLGTTCDRMVCDATTDNFEK